MVIFRKKYDGEDLYDLEGDMIAAFDKLYKEDPGNRMFDSEGLLAGMFKVTVEVIE